MSELKEGYQNLSVGQLGRLFGGSGGKMSSEFLNLSRFLWQHLVLCFPSGSDGKEFACNAGDAGFIPGLGRSPEEGNGNPLQYSCLENPMDRGAWLSMGSQKSWTWLSN